MLAVDHPATKIYSVSIECACSRPPKLQRHTQWAENVLGVDHPATKIYSVSIECACCRTPSQSYKDRPPSYKDMSRECACCWPLSYKDIVSELRMCLLLNTLLQRYTQLALNVLAVEHPATKIYSVSRECARCRSPSWHSLNREGACWPPSYKDILS